MNKFYTLKIDLMDYYSLGWESFFASVYLDSKTGKKIPYFFN
jgi:hypothetical protein